VLWQIGVIGELGPVTGASLGHLGLVADRLAAVHGADHEVVVYEASPYPIAAPLIERVPIRDLAAARVTPLATLYVPPSTSPAVDESVAAQLGLAPASR
jgi:hypothetical protein